MAPAFPVRPSAQLNSDLLEEIDRIAARGLMGRNQYALIVQQLAASPGSMLVFGLGHDSPLWWRCAAQQAAFVEDDVRFVHLAPRAAPVLLYEYRSQMGRSARVPAIPRLIDHPWDYVFVDGPRGYDRTCPGRQISIAWASRLACRAIFVHDYNRSWDRQMCTRFVGSPTLRLKDAAGKRGDLAMFTARAVRASAPR